MNIGKSIDKRDLKNTVGKVYKIVEPLVRERKLILWDIRFEKEGSDWFLRIIIDKEEGRIDFDDCEGISRPLSDSLDREDFIEQQYYLEVSSPGLERELRNINHFEYALGKEIFIKTIRKIDGEREFSGNLLEIGEDFIKISKDSDEKFFFISQCSFVKLRDFVIQEETDE